MQRIILALKQGLHKKILAVSLIFLTSFCSVLIFAQQPSYAVTTAKDKLSSDDKIDRAYNMSEATGFLEEDKQASPNANKTFDYNEKANERSVKSATEEDSSSNLIEKAQDLIKSVTGNE